MSSSSANSRGWVSRSSGVPGGSSFSRRGTSHHSMAPATRMPPRNKMASCTWGCSTLCSTGKVNRRTQPRERLKECRKQSLWQWTAAPTARQNVARDGDLFAHRVARHHTPGEVGGGSPREETLLRAILVSKVRAPEGPRRSREGCRQSQQY